MPHPALDPVTVLGQLTSRDPQQVWEAAHAVIRAPRSVQLLLVPFLPEIRQATQGLDLGGAWFPNSQHVEHAWRVLEAARSGLCPCQVYPAWLFYNPNDEAAAGAVEIVWQSEPDWNMTYRCRCVTCGRSYDVEQGEYHYTWWQWRHRPSDGSGTLEREA